MKTKVTYPYLIIFTLYIISYGMIFLNFGIFWDDWTIYNTSFNALKVQFDSNGLNYFKYLHYFLQNITPWPILIYKILIFTFYCFSNALIYRIFMYFNIKDYDSLLITLLIAVIPLNVARNYMICFPYTLSFFLFSAALFFFLKSMNNNSFLVRICSLALFFMSFMFMQSMLVFVYIPLTIFTINYSLNEFAINKSIRKFFPTFIKKIVRLLDFFLLPILFWVFKSSLFNTNGMYENYNKVKISNLFISPIKILLLLKQNLIDLYRFNILYLKIENIIIIFLPVFLITIFIVNRYKKLLIIDIINQKEKIDILIDDRDASFKNIKKDLQFLMIGIIFFFAGIFPYLVVSQIPDYNSVNSRHQILLGIGLCILIYNMLKIFLKITFFYMFKDKLFLYVLCMIISIFISRNIEQQFDINKAAIYTDALKLEFSKSEELVDGISFGYYDDLPSPFWRESLRFYTISGIYHEIYSKQDKFFMTRDAMSLFSQDVVKQFINESFKMKDAEFNGKYDYLIFVEQSEFIVTKKNMVQLFIAKLLDRKKYYEMLDSVLVVSFEKYNN